MKVLTNISLGRKENGFIHLMMGFFLAFQFIYVQVRSLNINRTATDVWYCAELQKHKERQKRQQKMVEKEKFYDCKNWILEPGQERQGPRRKLDTVSLSVSISVHTDCFLCSSLLLHTSSFPSSGHKMENDHFRSLCFLLVWKKIDHSFFLSHLLPSLSSAQKPKLESNIHY